MNGGTLDQRRRSVAAICARFPVPHSAEWRPRGVAEEAEEDGPVPEGEQAATLRWCKRAWVRPPTAVQYAVVDFLLHGGDQCPPENHDSFTRYLHSLRALVPGAIPEPMVSTELAQMVAHLVEEVCRSTGDETTQLPPDELRRPPAPRTHGAPSTGSHPPSQMVPCSQRARPGVAGTRVAPIDVLKPWRGDQAVRSSRLHALSQPTGTHVLQGGGARPWRRQAEQQREAVTQPLGEK
jgi:hypothetical protein